MSRVMVLIAIGSTLLAGCACDPGRGSFGSAQTSTHDQVVRHDAVWALPLTPEDALSMPSDNAKAILVARAAIEQRAKRAGRPMPDILGFEVNSGSYGWEVIVDYVSYWDGGKPFGALGDFSYVDISKDWKSIRILPGA